MDEKATTNLNSEDPNLEKENLEQKNNELAAEWAGKRVKEPEKKQKAWKVLLAIGIIGIIGGSGCLVAGFLKNSSNTEKITFPDLTSEKADEKVYSALTGEVLADSAQKTAPTYCIQTPNGTDGARPQAGLTEAGVVFEAIAEAGITRFAAIYQNPTSSVIGPIRSLRIYYLDWDTPFDCTIVHAGGADDALQAVSAGGYRDLSEDYNYMYRGTAGNRLWNNLFTTANDLKRFGSDHGYNTSNVKGFARMTPEESKKSRVDQTASEVLEITTLTEKDTSKVEPTVPSIDLIFGGWASFNVNYEYDAKTNTYLRSYESGANHDVYKCGSDDIGEKNPEDVCELTQMAPSVVVAMMVKESKDSDNYHEDITSIGSGKVYIFQNGVAIEGTWSKGSRDEQIKFTDNNGKEIKLAPGQTFVSAVPNYGSVAF